MKKTIGVVSLFAVALLISCKTSNQTKNDGTDNSFWKDLFHFSGKTDELSVNKFVNLTDSTTWSASIDEFYRNRDYRPAWTDRKKVSKNGKELLQELELSENEGLHASFYRLDEIKKTISALEGSAIRKDSLPSQLATLDVTMTGAYLDYASDLLTGRVDPQKLNIIWQSYPNQTNLAEHLENAIQTGSIKKSLDQLKPAYEKYALLKKTFGELHAAGSKEWPLPGNLKTLKENDSGQQVVRLKKYLLATGDLQNKDSAYISTPRFDRQLSEAVRKFQQRHGLKPDGIVSNATLQQMNIPLSARIDQIRINLDRIRWLPETFGKNYAIINIPSFSFRYYENGQPGLAMNVVVGKNENYTPILNDSLSSIIFNPSWNVPSSIAKRELLPKQKDDPDYFSKHHYILLKGSYAGKDTIDPGEVDWDTVSEKNFPYFIVQKPGKDNPLGKIEFLMTNQYNIYLHDTPARYLFSKNQRDFSHGCIRLEKPEELAHLLLKGKHPQDSIRKWLSKK